MSLREVKPIEWDRPTDYEIFQKGIFGGMGPRIDERYGYIPGFDPQMVLRYPQTRLPGQTGFELGDGFAMGTDPFGGGLAGRYLAQLPNKLTPVQAAAKSFGDIPILGNLIKTIRDYEDRINYRNADPETRKLLGLE